MKSLIWLLTLGLALMLLGCSHENIAPVSPDISKPVAKPMPAEVQRLLNVNSLPVNDGATPPDLAVSGNADPTVKDTLYDTYVVTFLWGSLLNITPPTPTLPPTDWTGTLTVDVEGMVAVTRTISFEAGQDYLLPVSEPTVTAWVSYTNGDFDGLNFLVRLRKGNTGTTPIAITFSTPLFTLQLSAVQMKWFAAYYQIDNINAVAVKACGISPANCPQGLMVGHWIKADVSGDHGAFNGTWMDDNGNATGVFAGTFWTETNGSRLFSGWVSGIITNQIIAYLNGTWYYDDPRLCPLCGAGHGRFNGFFKYASNSSDVGYVQGEFGSLTLPPDQLDLPLSGTWGVICHWYAPAVATPAD